MARFAKAGVNAVIARKSKDKFSGTKLQVFKDKNIVLAKLVNEGGNRYRYISKARKITS